MSATIGGPRGTLDARDLRLVSAIGEFGSLTRAGAILRLTQSALSRQLAGLESRLGIKVCEKVGRRLKLTPAGERLRTTAAHILSALAEAEDEVREQSSAHDTIVSIGTQCHTCYHWLPAVLQQTELVHPRVSVRVVPDATRNIPQALAEGRIDIGIVSRWKPPAAGRMEYAPLFRGEIVAVAAPNHRWRDRRWVSAEDFGAEHLFRCEQPRSQSGFLMTVLAPALVQPRRITEMQSTDAILELVAAGHGVSVMDHWAFRRHADQGRVILRRITAKGLYRDWGAVVSAPEQKLPVIRAVLKTLKEELGRSTGLAYGFEFAMSDAPVRRRRRKARAPNPKRSR